MPFVIIILVLIFSSPIYANEQPYQAFCEVEAEILSLDSGKFYYDQENFYDYVEVRIQKKRVNVFKPQNDLAACLPVVETEPTDVVRSWDWNHKGVLAYADGKSVAVHDHVNLVLSAAYVGDKFWPSIIEIKRFGTSPDNEKTSQDLSPEPAISVPANSTTERKIDKVYYLEGQLFSETNLFSDKNNGFYKTYHRNGRLATEIRYKDGVQVYDKAFDEKGLPIIRNGLFKTYYADGHVASAGEYQHDLKNGKEEFYYYDGQTVLDVWHYMDGRQVGEHIRNDSNGRFQYSEDRGYPTYYVRKLEKVIVALGGLLICCLIGFGFSRRNKSTHLLL